MSLTERYKSLPKSVKIALWGLLLIGGIAGSHRSEQTMIDHRTYAECLQDTTCRQQFHKLQVEKEIARLHQEQDRINNLGR